MPHNQYVVRLSETSDMYLTGYNPFTPENSVFGNLGDAIIYSNLQDAQEIAASIGGGTVGTTKPH